MGHCSPTPTVSSRWDDPAELAAMERALRALRPCDRRAIAEVWCNSKIGSYFLTLQPTTRVADCHPVGIAFHQALTRVTGGHVLTVRAGTYWEADYDSRPDEAENDPDEAENETYYELCCAACGCLRRVGGAS